MAGGVPPPLATAARTFALLHERRHAGRAALAAAALAKVDRLARIAVAHGARRVWLFGSLVTGDWHSVDIDLAVEGVADSIHLGVRLEAAAHPIAVDVVDIEDAPPLLKAEILERGRLLFEQPDGRAAR